MPRRPLWIAHRGASREHRENSLPAFARALALGADAIELDVHATADGVVVVHHDFDLPGADGAPLPIAGSTLDALLHHGRDRGTPVPTLADVLALVGTRAELLVELKGADIEEPVLAALRGHDGAFAIHSFDHAQVARAAQVAPEVRRGLLFDAPPADLQASVEGAAAHDVWPRRDVATAAFTAQARALGLRTIAWTVNDAAEAAALVALGVDGICTDDLPAVRPFA